MTRVAVTGATGTIGRALAGVLRERGDDVLALTRNRDSAREVLGQDLEIHEWINPKTTPPPEQALARADAVVHLLGEPIAQRWSTKAKREIYDSRVLSTRSLVRALRAMAADRVPSILVCQSATGYYGPRGAEPITEEATAGDDFVAGVVVAWEQEAQAAERDLPVVRTRTGVVLSPTGGALATMLPFFRLGLGGPVAGGRQYVPWIHLDDVVAGIVRCLDDPALAGAVNLTAPNPVTNREFSRGLGAAVDRPAVLPVPAAGLRLLYGEMAQIVTTGQRVVPKRLQEAGHLFVQPHLEPALHDVLTRR